MAFAYLALSVVGLATLAVESIAMRNMLSLSLAPRTRPVCVGRGPGEAGFTGWLLIKGTRTERLETS